MLTSGGIITAITAALPLSNQQKLCWERYKNEQVTPVTVTIYMVAKECLLTGLDLTTLAGMANQATFVGIIGLFSLSKWWLGFKC